MVTDGSLVSLRARAERVRDWPGFGLVMGSLPTDKELAADVLSLLHDNEYLLDRAEAAEARLLAAQQALREANELLEQGIAWSPQGKHHFWVRKVTEWQGRVAALAAVGRVPAQEDSE